MLKKVLRAIVDLNGLDFIKKPQFLNVLNDYKAFDKYPGAKFVLKSIIQDGFVDKILHKLSNQNDTLNSAEKFVSALYINYGFRKDIAVEVMNALLFATGHNDMLLSTEPSEINSTDLSTSNEPHIVFSQISLVHTIKDIERHMMKRGFKTIATNPYQISMEGSFCGMDDTKLYIYGSPAGLTTRVYLQNKPVTNMQAFSYCKTLYDLLCDKYGNPDNMNDPLDTILHNFDQNIYFKCVCEYAQMINDYQEIFSAIWDVYGGQIKLHWFGDRICLTYTDSINSELAERHQNQFNSESI